MNRFRYAAKNAWLSFRRAPWINFVGVATITIALLLVGAFMVIFPNIHRLGKKLNPSRQLSIYLKPDISRAAITVISKTLHRRSDVDKVRFQDRHAALKSFQAELGKDVSLLQNLGEDLMENSFEVTLSTASLDSRKLAAFAAEAERWPGVSQVDYGQEYLAQWHSLAEMINLAVWLLGGLLILAVVFIVANTIRLTVFGRREEIEIMRLVGATDFYIKLPFYLEGSLQGLLASGMAVGALYLVYLPLAPLVKQLLSSLMISFVPTFMSAGMIALFILGGILIGFLGSFVALIRHLRMR